MQTNSHNINNCLKILVLGYIVRWPLGGMAWHHINYALGLFRLGYDVYFLEYSDNYDSCYNPESGVIGKDATYGLNFTKDAFDRLGIKDRWAYYDEHTSCWLGAARNINDIIETADMVINISGVNPLKSELMNIPIRLLVDTDPAFTQIKHLQDAQSRERTKLHTHYFSFGENFGNDNCLIPDDGFPWKPTRQPIVLDEWQITPGPEKGKFTTVMKWDSYPAQKYQERYYGMKSESFRDYFDLPNKVKADFELALGSASAPRDTLKSKGWQIVNPLNVTKDPWTYQKYIQESKGEFTVAKHGYVVSNSGWFSERSAAYLASGRPVITQETEFSKYIPCGRGLLAFGNFDEAIAAIEEINGNYDRHCRWAREIAEEYFDSKKVLADLIENAL